MLAIRGICSKLNVRNKSFFFWQIRGYHYGLRCVWHTLNSSMQAMCNRLHIWRMPFLAGNGMEQSVVSQQLAIPGQRVQRESLL